MYVVDRALSKRLEAAEARFYREWLDAFAQMPGNPYGAETATYGNLVALVCRRYPRYSLWNRIMCAGPGDEADLEQAMAFLWAAGMPLRVDVSPLQQDQGWLSHLHGLGLTMGGFQVALFGETPDQIDLSLPPGVEIRLATTPEDLDAAGEIQAVAFEAKPDAVIFLKEMLTVVAGQPQFRTYLALADGQPAGMACLHIADGVGSLASAGTLPAFRGRGIQSALLRRRIADAALAGCDLMASQTGNGTTSQHNMERMGLRIAYSKAEFYETLQ